MPSTLATTAPAPRPHSPRQLQAIAQAINPKVLSLTILPTEKCNFRCTYCYEDFELGKMPRDVIDGLKRLISHRMADVKYLTLNWFGGEPLVALDIIREIAQHAQRECKLNDVALLAGEVTTNASLLTVPVFEELVKLGQSHFQISLDGWKEGHDQTRQLGDGSGTFDQVWGNLLAIRDSSIAGTIMLRIHLTNQNADSARELARNIKLEFGNDKRFTTFLKAIENLGGPNSASIKKIDKVAQTDLEAELTEILNGVPSRSGKAMHDSQEYVCYASKPNSLIVRSNGRLAKCTVAFNDPKNDIGQIQSDGRLQIEDEKLGFWFRGIYAKDMQVLGCPVFVHPHEANFKRKIPIAVASA